MMERVEVQNAVNKFKIDVVLMIKKRIERYVFLFPIGFPTCQNMVNQR